MAQYDLNLRDYWRILRKRKGIVIFITLMVGLSSFLLATLRRSVPLYQASASVKIEKVSTLTGLYLETLSRSPADDLETQALLIRSYPSWRRWPNGSASCRKA